MTEKDLTEKTVLSKQVYDGALLKVYRDEITLPNGNPSGREYIKHNGAVCIVPLTDDNKVVVERQFRYPLHRVITELPAGKLDSPDEDHLEAAKRELKEETGYSADTWIPIGSIHPSVAYTDECIWLYIAKDLHKGDRNLDDDEFLNVELIPLNDLVCQVMDGTITDSKSIAAILKTDKIACK